MKTIALLPLVAVLFACTSSSGVAANRVFDCDSGQPLEVRAGLENARASAVVDINDDLVYLVEVANNSHEDVVVETIRIDTASAGGETASLDPVSRSVKQAIPSGKDHLFRFPTRFRVTPMAGDRLPDARRLVMPREMNVTIVLENGDAYRCSFGLGR
jgi:hypothetical protein